MMVLMAWELKKLYNVLPPSQNSPPMYRTIRPEVWHPSIWEKQAGAIQRRSHFMFPAPDLMSQMVSLYFQEVNIYLPVLHRPTFEHSVETHLHLRDDSFARIVLVVCAIGSRWSKDERVFPEEKTRTNQSRGWVWFNNAHEQRLAYATMASLYDLQFSAVRACYSFLHPRNSFMRAVERHLPIISSTPIRGLESRRFWDSYGGRHWCT